MWKEWMHAWLYKMETNNTCSRLQLLEKKKKAKYIRLTSNCCSRSLCRLRCVTDFHPPSGRFSNTITTFSLLRQKVPKETNICHVRCWNMDGICLSSPLSVELMHTGLLVWFSITWCSVVLGFAFTLYRSPCCHNKKETPCRRNNQQSIQSCSLFSNINY